MSKCTGKHRHESGRKQCSAPYEEMFDRIHLVHDNAHILIRFLLNHFGFNFKMAFSPPERLLFVS